MSETTRKLTAVLAADVAGYSGLMARDESGTLAALRHLRDDVLGPAAAGHRGRIVKDMGDGWLADFDSITDATRCAIRVQTEPGGQEDQPGPTPGPTLGPALGPAPALSLRIGIHAGDVVFTANDMYGDGVNIAARLQQMAPPGGILLSGSALNGLDPSLRRDFVALGARRLKNIPTAVLVHGWRGADAGTNPGNDAGGTVPDGTVVLLVSLARAGDRAAFADLVRQNQSWIRNMMRRAAGDPALADDLAQQVFLLAWRRIRQIRDPARFRGWLRRIAVRVWVDTLRRQGPLDQALSDTPDHDGTEQAEPGSAPAAAGYRAQQTPGLGIDLDRALARLPGAVRLCIVLAYQEGLTHGEIAGLTGLPAGTVKSHIRRGTARLRAALADYQENGGT